MGFYIRKAFSAGPIRLNLSKSGLGVSFGVKGARIGKGPRGSYVHAGRYGLYYRQSLSSRKKTGPEQYFKPSRKYSKPIDYSDPVQAEQQQIMDNYLKGYKERHSNRGCVTIIGVLVFVIVGSYLMTWLTAHTTFAIVLLISLAVIGIIWFVLRRARNNKIKLEKENLHMKLNGYKKLLDDAFIISEAIPDTSKVIQLEEYRRSTFITQPEIDSCLEIERNVYRGVLDKILDDNSISEDEAKTIQVADTVFLLPEEEKKTIKKEIFSSAYLQAIEDDTLTLEELNHLSNLLVGLDIPIESLEEEIEIMKQFIDSYDIQNPVPEVDPKEVPINLMASEKAYLVSDARVVSKARSDEVPDGDRWKLEREGILVITNKRLIVAGIGSTNVRFSEIAYIDIDLDQRIIEITKTTSRKPVCILSENFIIAARIMELLMGK